MEYQLASTQAHDGNRSRCHYCPDKPANHPIERCWRIRTAIRGHFGAETLPEALAKTGGQRADTPRGRGAGRGGFTPSRGRGRAGWARGGSRPQWREVQNKVASLQADLDNLVLDEEPGEDVPGEEEEAEPDQLFQ